MKTGADNVVRIPTSIDTNFFKYWFEFLKPFHNLPERGINVATALAKHRYELSKKIKDENLLDEIVMSADTKRKVREELGLSATHFHVIISILKEKNIIVNNRMNPKFLPNITEGKNNFQLLLFFDFNGT